MGRSVSLIVAGFGIGLTAFAAAAPAQMINQGAVDQVCAPRAVWTRAEAERCIGTSYRLGAEQGLWPSGQQTPAR